MPETESRKRKEPDALTTRTGGAYIPPAKLRMMQKDIQDKSSTEFQRLAWEQLKKAINGLINKVNTSNITTIVRELIKQNLVRGRGLLCRSIMQAQSASQTFTNVYAALVAIINSKFPNIGELLLKRLVIQFRRGYKRNDKPTCLSAAKFIAHLVNQQIAHEVLALEILTLLLEHPTEDSVEVAVAFLKEVGARLEEVSPRGAHAIFERLRHVLHEGQLEKRVQYMIEVMFQVRKDKFKDFPTLPDELDLVEEEDQFTHLLTLDEVTEGQDILNVFKVDQDFIENEDKYSTLRKEILDESDEEGSGEEEDDDDADEDEEGEGEGKDVIIDKTETNMLALRRTIYLTIQSSLDFEECCHKILKLNLKEGQEVELCHMILDCCAQQRTYEKFFGLLAQRFCSLTSGRKYIEPFQQIFKDTYDTVHRLDTNKLRNVAKFFAHLLYTDAIAWTVMEHIRLTEDDTTSSSRIFIKILMQELSEFMGLQKLNQRLQDPTLVSHFEGLFPRDHPKNTRFSINFFTSVGLGGLTDELREFLKKQPKPTAVIAPQRTESPEPAGSGSPSSSSTSSSSDSSSDSSSSDSSDDSSSSDSSSSSSDSSSDSDSSSTSSSEEDKKKRKKKQKEKAKVSLPPRKKSKDSKSKKDTKSSKSSKSKRGESSSPEKAVESIRDRRKKNKDDLLRGESQNDRKRDRKADGLSHSHRRNSPAKNEQVKSSMSLKRPSALDFFENDRNLYRPEGTARYDNERRSRSRDRDMATISRENERGRGRKDRSRSREVAYEPLEMLRNRKRMDRSKERKDDEEKNRKRMERSRSREAYERDGDDRGRKRKERSRSRELPSTSRESERGRGRKDRSRSRELPSTSRESERGRGRKDRSRSRELAYASRKEADDRRSDGRRNDRSRSREREYTPEPPPPPPRDRDDKERSSRKRRDEHSRSREREYTPEPREDKERGRRRTRDDRSRSRELAYSTRDDETRRERRDRSKSRELTHGSQSRDKDDTSRRRREEISRSRDRELDYEAREDDRSSKRKQRSVSRERGYWSRDEIDLSSSRRKREERSRSREVDSERRKKSSKQKKEKDRSRSRSRELEYESRGKHKSSKRQRVDRSRSK